MTDPAGPFYSTQDADSEGEEGKFYVWSRAEVEAVLGAGADLFCAVYDVTPAGNWEGHNIPNRPRDWDAQSRALGRPADELRAACRRLGDRLYEVRGRRVWPGRDEKILTAWNGLMISALSLAGATFGEPRYTAGAARAAAFILEHVRKSDGRLLRTTAVGSPPKLDAYLEDYSFLIDALVSLYQATFEARWVREAVRLAEVMIADFADPAGGFFYTATGHEQLITRTKDSFDGSTPSGNAMAATGLLRLAALTGRGDLRDSAERTLTAFAGPMRDSPSGMGQMLAALDFYLGPANEVAVIGAVDSGAVQRVLAAIRERFLPTVVLAAHEPGTSDADADLIPLLHDRPARDAVSTYLCENFTCQAPAVGIDDSLAAVAKL
jgi:uncharacterized protein YyaL (SSP411 family)